MIDQQPISQRSISSFPRESATSVDIIKLLDKLEELVEDSPQVFGRALWINADQFFVHTNKIRAFLPDEMKNASRLNRDSERWAEEVREESMRAVNEAREQADEILNEAQARAAQTVSSSEIRRIAEEQARALVAQAKSEAAEVRRGADDYAREVLASLDGFLGRILGTIERGRAKLDERGGTSPG